MNRRIVSKRTCIGIFLIILQVLTLFEPALVRAAEMERPARRPKVIEVDNVNDLIGGWDDNVTLVLAPGQYNLTEYLNSLSNPKPWLYDREMEQGLYLREEFDGPELIIDGYENVTIVSADKKHPAELVCEPRYADVLSFVDCKEILIDGVSLGHTPEQGSCAGDVLSLTDCSSVVVSDSELYGCGTYAFTIDDSEYITVMDCDIHDCSYGCAVVAGTENLSFIHCDFHDCKEFTMFEVMGGSTDFIGCDFKNLDGNFLSNEGGDVSFVLCSFDPQIEEELKQGGYLTEKQRPKTEEPKEESTKAEPSKEEPQNTAQPKTENAEKIQYTAAEHPLELYDEDMLLATGNYYELILSEEAKEAFPKLAEALEKRNKEDKEQVTSDIMDMEEDSREMNETAFEVSFSEERELIPTRADEKAFSYVYRVYSYLGGAHGYSYPTAVNIDPATGEDIPFTAVVKDTTDLPEIMYEELLKQNDDLEEYFSYDEAGKNYLFEDNEGRLANDGETLCWALACDGIWIFYEDYAMGSYVAGSREELIRFADYPEIFTDTYVNGGEMSDIDKQVRRETKPTETLKSKRHELRTIPLSFHFETFYPEDETEDNYAYQAFAEEYKADESRPGLKKALDEWNSLMEEDLEGSLEAIGKLAKKAYKEEGTDEFRYYQAGYRQSLRRADENFLSFAVYEEDTFAPKLMRIVLGKNFDTKTGKELELTDVVTDTQAFLQAAGDELGKVFYDEELRAEILSELSDRLSDKSTISSEELSWCLGYEGMELYLNPDINYNFYGDTDGPVKLFFSYSGYPKLFSDQVREIPGAYAYELEINDYPEVCYIDTDGDGKLSEVSVVLYGDEDYYHSTLSLSIDGRTTRFAGDEGVGGYEASAIIVHTYQGDDFLYLNQMTDNDYEYISVYSLGEEPKYIGEKNGTTRFELWSDSEDSGEDEQESTGYIMTYPGDFKLWSVNSVLGSLAVTGDYKVGWDGLPQLEGYYEDFVDQGDWFITVSQDIDSQIVNENGDIQTDSVLKKGTKVQPYRFIEWGAVLLKAEDGSYWRINLDKNEDELYTLNGKTMDELFEGLIYAG
ncbi:MAG: right-handed parallel beta-helix repeat-containing protein [Lachnospiraceae bacterium]|nr:right-handed parallel beta-helix repeat-containing protein [Lachnospiraceae bacterium]